MSFDDIDYKDAEKLRQAKESMLREEFIRVSALKTLRRSLEQCYKVSGVNAYEECKPMADKYIDLLPENTVAGYMFYMRNDPSK